VAVRVVTRVLDGYAAAAAQRAKAAARAAPRHRRDDPGRGQTQDATAAAPETPKDT